MPTVTVQVSEELKKQMESMDEVNWSAVARKSFENRVKLRNLLDKIAETSTMTEEDAVLLGRELKKGTFEKYYAPSLQRKHSLRSNNKK